MNKRQAKKMRRKISKAAQKQINEDTPAFQALLRTYTGMMFGNVDVGETFSVGHNFGFKKEDCREVGKKKNQE